MMDSAPCENQRIGRYVSLLYRRSQAYLARKFQGIGLSAATYTPLMTLYRHDGMSQEQLADHIGIDKAAMKRAIDDLVKGGFAGRIKHETDGRAYRIMLTEKAKDIMPEVERTLNEWENIILAGMDGAERETAKALLARMAENASLNEL
jgi:DNA-binding MarR family transcriptional regulator